MTERLSNGSTAPGFTLPNAENREVSLSDYAGSKVIVYFYPAALTRGCTLQAEDFTAAAQELSAAGYTVLGISPDDPAKLQKFKDHSKITFELLSDPDFTVTKSYAAYGSKTLYGKKIEGLLRSTFVISVADDGTGTVELAQYNVRATGHVERLRRHLGLTQ